MRIKQPELRRARIEIIPMIDTIFFLLVYFMIVSLGMTPLNAEKVRMPVSTTASLHPEREVIVTVDREGACLVDRDRILPAHLTAALHARLAGDPALTVIINCDRSQPASTFTSVFDLVKQANPASVMVATSPTDVEAVH